METGNKKQLLEWRLKDYIDVAHEMGWISQTGKDVGHVLRDYRNFIHPYKEFSNNINLSKSDAHILWDVTKSICRQLIG